MNGNEEQRAEALVRRFLGGDLSRRTFLRRAGGFSVAAMSATSLGAVLAACTKSSGSAAGRRVTPGLIVNVPVGAAGVPAQVHVAAARAEVAPPAAMATTLLSPRGTFVCP